MLTSVFLSPMYRRRLHPATKLVIGKLLYETIRLYSHHLWPNTLAPWLCKNKKIKRTCCVTYWISIFSILVPNLRWTIHDFTDLNFGSSQNTHSEASSICTSRWVFAKSLLFDAMTIGISWWYQNENHVAFCFCYLGLCFLFCLFIFIWTSIRCAMLDNRFKVQTGAFICIRTTQQKDTW